MTDGYVFVVGALLAPTPEQQAPANVVIAVGSCGLYTGPFGVRVEDTVVVQPGGPAVLTSYSKSLVRG